MGFLDVLNNSLQIFCVGCAVSSRGLRQRDKTSNHLYLFASISLYNHSKDQTGIFGHLYLNNSLRATRRFSRWHYCTQATFTKSLVTFPPETC